MPIFAAYESGGIVYRVEENHLIVSRKRSSKIERIQFSNISMGFRFADSNYNEPIEILIVFVSPYYGSYIINHNGNDNMYHFFSCLLKKRNMNLDAALMKKGVLKRNPV